MSSMLTEQTCAITINVLALVKIKAEEMCDVNNAWARGVLDGSGR